MRWTSQMLKLPPTQANKHTGSQRLVVAVQAALKSTIAATASTLYGRQFTFSLSTTFLGGLNLLPQISWAMQISGIQINQILQES